jgi:tetratricopeptide (TPR) repeat protein
LVGRPHNARDIAERVLAAAHDRDERANEAWTLRLLGEIAASTDPPDAEQAETYYRQALALAETFGMRPLMAHCRLGLGTLFQKLGRDEQARGELTTAAELYRAMEMSSWLAKAEEAVAHVDR